MCRSEGCAGWLSASEANGTHRCGSCELVPPAVFQAEQWPATRKPGDRDRDALIVPLDARQTQTAGRGGATADGVAFDAIELVAEFPGDGQGWGVVVECSRGRFSRIDCGEGQVRDRGTHLGADAPAGVSLGERAAISNRRTDTHQLGTLAPGCPTRREPRTVRPPPSPKPLRDHRPRHYATPCEEAQIKLVDPGAAV